MFSRDTKSSYNSSSYERSRNDSQFIFELELDDASMINRILLEVSDPDDNSTLIVTKDGLRLVATGDRTTQQSAFFDKLLFQKFTFNGPDVKFRFALKEFIECLGLLQDDPKDEDSSPAKVALKMRYTKKGDPLKLKLISGATYSVNCDLKEFSLSQVHTMMGFASHEEITDIVFHSKELYRFVSGMDFTSIFLKLILEPGPVPVRMKTHSAEKGQVELEIINDDVDLKIIHRHLNVPHNMVFNFSYRCSFIRPALEALKSSNYMKLRCGSTGLLLMEHMYGEEPRVQSVEYFILSEAVM